MTDKTDKISLRAPSGERREFKVEWWPVARPKPYYRNPRNNDEAVPAVREPTDMVFCPKPLRSELHPTMKPVGLWRYLMGNSSEHGEIVLDPFGGSGTTIVTAEVTGRKARSAELDPHYCDVIRKRWAELALGKDADWQAATPEEAQ